jgi:hypothetical protein
MIVLADDKELAMGLCADERDARNIFIETGYDNWKGLAELHSELGRRIFLSGDEAEGWLDSSGIYYVHMERGDSDGTLSGFRARLEEEIESRRTIIDRNRVSDGKGETMVYGLVRGDFGEKATFLTDNCLELAMDSKGAIHTTLSIGDGKGIHEAIGELREIITRAERDLGEAGFGVEEMDFYDDLSLSVSDSIPEAISKLKMRLGIMMASAGEL